MRAETEVATEAEREVTGRVGAGHVEAEGIREHVVVAIGRRVRQQRDVTGLECHVPHGERRLTRADEVLHR